MGTARIHEYATLGKMRRLGDLVDKEIEALESLEKAGKESTTHSEAFEGRTGYDPDFLDGWSIPMPRAKDEHGADMRELARGGTGVELKYQNFSVIMSVARRFSMITATNIDGRQSVPLPRAKTWKFDGRLNKEDQWGDAIYDGNILDRGHMVRREDPVWGEFAERANKDTFHFTNSCPQVAEVNQVTWLGLENYILKHARSDEMRVNVYTGPFFKEDDIIYRGARIPSSFWKVVAIVTEDGRPSATAYKISQAKELAELEFVFKAYKTFQISIKQVMGNSQIDFSSLLPYDGFTHEEEARKVGMEVKIETLDNIRI